MEEIKFCPKCSHPNPTSSHVCEACGASLDHNEVQPTPEVDQGYQQIYPGAYTVNAEPPIQVIDDPKPLSFSIAFRISLFMGWISILISSLITVGAVTYLVAMILTNKADLFTIIVFTTLITLEVISFAMIFFIRPYVTSKQSQKQMEAMSNYRFEIYSDRFCWASDYKKNDGTILPFHQMVLIKDIYSYKEYNDIFIFGVYVGNRKTCFAMRKHTLSEASMKIVRDRIEEIKNMNRN